MKQRLIIIGNGMAGSRLASELLARDGASKFEITIFGDEPGGAYNRILLSDVLNGSKSAESVVTHSPQWYAERGVTLRAGEKIVAIDRENRFVESEHGARESSMCWCWRQGSSPLVPPMDV
jgi:nitrite reductase (NADH) large subunit